MLPGQVVLRSEWFASEYAGTIEPLLKFGCIVIHHAPGHRAADRSDGLAVVREIQSLHQHSPDRKWSDIGYHFLVDLSGNIYEGRAPFNPNAATLRERLSVGAHTYGRNRESVGICILGSFQPGFDNCEGVLPDSAAHSLEWLCKYLCDELNIPVSRISGHREHAPDAVCPGDLLLQEVQRLRLCLNLQEMEVAV